MWTDAALCALWVATVGQVCFVALYMTAPWRRHFVGRALFTKSAALALVLVASLVNWYFTYPYQVQVGACLMWLVALAILFQFGALVWQQHLDRSARRR